MDNMLNKLGRKTVQLLFVVAFLLLSISPAFATGVTVRAIENAFTPAQTAYTAVWNSATPAAYLPVGNVVQIFNVGPDGQLNTPNPANPHFTGGDDTWIADVAIGTGTGNKAGSFNSNQGTLSGITIGVRAWEGAAPGATVKYGNSSELKAVPGAGQAPITWDVPDITTNQSVPVANAAPNTPTSLAQAIANNAWVNTNFNATMSMTDPNNPDTLTPQVEVVTGAFTNTPNMIGTAVAYSGAAVTGTVSINVASLSDGTYKWQGRVADAASATSSFAAFGGNPNAFRVDKTGPTIGTITSPSTPRNNTSLTFSWTAATDSGSGLGATPYYYLRDSNAATTANTVRTTGTGTTNLNITVTGVAGTNYLHIVAVDALGNVSSVAHSSAVVVDTTAPTMTFNPTNGSNNVSTGQNVVITFSEAINTGSLTYTINPDPGGRSVVWSGGNTIATISHTAFNVSTSYTVTVTAAQDVAGNNYSGTNSTTFTTAAAANNPPNAFTLSAPANNATNVAIRPTFTWNAATDPDGDPVTYTLVVSANSNLSNPVINQTGLNTTSYTATTDLANNNLYYWRVTAADNRGGSTNSTNWSFTTETGTSNNPNITKVYNKVYTTDAGVFVTPYDPNARPWQPGDPTDDTLNLYIEGTNFAPNGYSTSETPAGASVAVLPTGFSAYQAIPDAPSVPDRIYYWEAGKIELSVPDKLGTTSVVAGPAKIRVTTANGNSNEFDLSIRPKVYGLPSSGKPGDTIAITGTAFGTDTSKISVRFGSTTATPITATGTSLAVVVPTSLATNQAYAVIVSVNAATSEVNTFFTGVNNAPVAQNVSVATGIGAAVDITLNATDADGDALTYSIVTSPAHGATGAISGNKVTYTPTSGYTGTDSFTYKANDGKADSNIATVAISISEGPVLNSINPNATPAGTRIVLQGLRFGSSQGGNSSVVFNNLTSKASYPVTNIISWSDTTIEALVPVLATAGTYEVKVVRGFISQGIVNALESNPTGFQVTSASAAGTATVWPNPFNPQAGQLANIAFNLPAGTTNVGVYIFDMTAKQVNKQVIAINQTTWDGRDLLGTLVGDGAYIVRIINEDTKSLIAKGKILVVKR